MADASRFYATGGEGKHMEAINAAGRQTVTMRVGIVQRVAAGRGWTVTVDAEECIAARAAGCLLVPSEGDLVLLADAGGRGVFVVQVLTRADDQAALVQLPSVSSVSAGENGRLDIGAGEMSLTGGGLTSRFKRVTASAGVVEETAELMRERYGRHYEEVREVRDTRLGRLRCLVGGLLSLRGRRVDVKAEKRLKLDGEGVDIG